MKKQFQVIEVLSNLNSIRRVGPTIFAGIDPSNLPSIAAHSFQVAYLCLIFGNKVDGVNVDKIVKMAIMHDWPEAILGDNPTGSKSYQSYFKEDIRGIIKVAESEAMKTLLSDAEIALTELSEIENNLLNFCDELCNALEMIELRQKGFRHKWIEKMFKVQIDKLNEYDFGFMIDVIANLRNMYENGMDNVYLTRATNKL